MPGDPPRKWLTLADLKPIAASSPPEPRPRDR